MTPAPKPDKPTSKGTSLWLDAWYRFRASKLAVVCLFIVLLYVVVALLVGLGVIAGDWEKKVGKDYHPPSWGWWIVDKAFRLDPDFDTPPHGDNVTTLESVSLTGRTDPNRPVELLERVGMDQVKKLAETTADAKGNFTFTKVKLEMGDSSFEARATDAAGPAFHERLKVTRLNPEDVGDAIDLSMGADIFGRSVLRKTLYGAKISLTVAFLASLLAIGIGVPMGAIAGYFGGFVDEIVVWLYSTLSSIPGFLLILAFAFVLKDKLPGLTAVYLALGLTSWVPLCRLIRGEVLKHKNRDYVVAAQAFGASRTRIIFRHVLPNVSHLIIIDFSLRFVAFIHAEVILSYLGLGPKTEPSWGTMIDDAKLELARGVWWQLAAATLAVFLISLALNIVGDRLRDALDPKLRYD